MEKNNFKHLVSFIADNALERKTSYEEYTKAFWDAVAIIRLIQDELSKEMLNILLHGTEAEKNNALFVFPLVMGFDGMYYHEILETIEKLEKESDNPEFKYMCQLSMVRNPLFFSQLENMPTFVNLVKKGYPEIRWDIPWRIAEQRPIFSKELLTEIIEHDKDESVIKTAQNVLNMTYAQEKKVKRCFGTHIKRW